MCLRPRTSKGEDPGSLLGQEAGFNVLVIREEWGLHWTRLQCPVGRMHSLHGPGSHVSTASILYLWSPTPANPHERWESPTNLIPQDQYGANTDKSGRCPLGGSGPAREAQALLPWDLLSILQWWPPCETYRPPDPASLRHSWGVGSCTPLPDNHTIPHILLQQTLPQASEALWTITTRFLYIYSAAKHLIFSPSSESFREHRGECSVSHPLCTCMGMSPG